MQAKDVKVVGRYSLTMHILSSPSPLEVDPARLAGNGCRYSGNIVAELAPRIPIDVDGIAVIGRSGDSLHHGSKPLRLRIRKRPQKQRVHHAENRRVRADAQCQREDDDNGKASVLRQLFHCIT